MNEYFWMYGIGVRTYLLPMPQGNSHYLQEELYSRLQLDPVLFDFLREDSMDGLWYWDLESLEDEWMDSRFWEVLGVNPETKQHKSCEWQDLIFPEDLELAKENFRKHCEDPSHPYDQVVRYHHHNGSTVWVRCRGMAIRNPEGIPIRMLGVHTDLTHLKRIEHQLRETNRAVTDEFSSIWEKSPVMHLQVAPEDYTIRKCNWNLVKRLGYGSKEDMQGKSVLDLYHPDCKGAAREAFLSLMPDGKQENSELQLQAVDGETFPILQNVAAVSDGNNGIRHYTVTLVEISELRRLQESERRSSFALEHATVSFYLVDPNANILQVNNSTCENTGFSKQELESMTVHDINPEFPRESWTGHWHELREKQFLRFESNILRKDGSTYPVEIETNYVVFEGEEFNFAFVRDISERKAWIREKELNEAKLEALVEERAKDLVEERHKAILKAKEAEAARKRAEAAEQELTSLASRLALPRAHRENTKTTFSIHDLTLKDVMICGGLLRKSSLNYKNQEDYLGYVAEFLHQHFSNADGNPVFEQILVHIGKAYTEMPHYLKTGSKSYHQINKDTPFLYLAAKDSNFNVQQSDFPFIDLISVEDPHLSEQSPHLENLLHQLGLRESCASQDGTMNVYKEIAAIHIRGEDSHNWPAMELANLPGTISEILGFGQKLTETEFFLITAFSREPVSNENAHRFVYLAHSVRLGILQFQEGQHSTLNQIQAVDAMLAGHEDFATEQEESLRDTMSALTNANKELKRSNNELDQFAYAASHDLKSPLFAIQNLMYVLKEDFEEELPEEAWEVCDKVNQRLGQMEELLESMLQYSRIGLVEDIPEEQDLNELLDTIVTTLLDVPQTMDVHIQQNLPSINAPRGALLRVFSNLLNNALKHGGKLNLKICVTYEDIGHSHLFTIQDDGVGIESKHHSRIFHLFKTLDHHSNYGSSGIGLSLVKKTIEHFGGKISVESQLGKGTVFSFTWPK